VIAWLLLASAAADPASDLLESRERVEQTAAEVAAARADGARRADVAVLMATYRDAAAELERLELAVGPPPEQLRRERMDAVSELTRALAEGVGDTPARNVIARWLGDPILRAALLDHAIATSVGTPTAIRRGVLLDVIEQADALAAWMSFDAAAEDARSSQLELRALSLRRRGPAQAAPIEDEVAAVRLEEEARRAGADAAELLRVRASVLEMRRRAVAALGHEEDR
jgi:hypothetical protein